MKWIKEFADGDRVIGQLLVASAVKGVTDKNLSYINVVFRDKTGDIDARKWDATEEDLKVLVPGVVVNVDGNVNTYKNALQMKVNAVSSIDDVSNIDLLRFQKCSPIPLEELKARLDAYLHSFKDKDVDKIVNAVMAKFYDRYIIYPAAVRIHHEFASGIIHHSLAMADLAEQVAKLYPQVDRDILVAGAILHDVGKTVEYANPMTPTITTEGKLIGHISIMYAEFKKIVDEMHIESEVPLLLEHMILAHHGKLEWGSPVLPMTREALLLSMIDLLDSHMMVVDKALDTVQPGEFTQRVWAIDDVAFYKPKTR